MPCHTYVPCRVVPCRARVLAWFCSPSHVSHGYVCARAQLVSEEKAREMLAEAVELITDDEATSVADGASSHERHDRLSFDQFCLLMLMDDGAPPPDMAHTPALPSPAGFDGAITPTSAPPQQRRGSSLTVDSGHGSGPGGWHSTMRLASPHSTLHRDGAVGAHTPHGSERSRGSHTGGDGDPPSTSPVAFGRRAGQRSPSYMTPQSAVPPGRVHRGDLHLASPMSYHAAAGSEPTPIHAAHAVHALRGAHGSARRRMMLPDSSMSSSDEAAADDKRGDAKAHSGSAFWRGGGGGGDDSDSDDSGIADVAVVTLFKNQDTAARHSKGSTPLPASRLDAAASQGTGSHRSHGTSASGSGSGRSTEHRAAGGDADVPTTTTPAAVKTAGPGPGTGGGQGKGQGTGAHALHRRKIPPKLGDGATSSGTKHQSRSAKSAAATRERSGAPRPAMRAPPQSAQGSLPPATGLGPALKPSKRRAVSASHSRQVSDASAANVLTAGGDRAGSLSPLPPSVQPASSPPRRGSEPRRLQFGALDAASGSDATSSGRARGRRASVEREVRRRMAAQVSVGGWTASPSHHGAGADRANGSGRAEYGRRAGQK